MGDAVSLSMKGIRNKRKNSAGGFTLVEVIIVLVLLAILASMLIPSIIGWIEKAEEKKLVVETRGIKMAAQTALSEQYGENPAEIRAGGDKFSVSPYGRHGRISNNMLCTVQRNQVTADTSKIDAAIAKSVLQLLDSENRNTAQYKFKSKYAPLRGQTVSDYEATYNQPGIIVLYNSKAEVICVEFGVDGYLCRIYDGKVITEKDGKFTTHTSSQS